MRNCVLSAIRLLFVCLTISKVIEGTYIPPALIPFGLDFQDVQILSFSVGPNPKDDGPSLELPVIGNQPAATGSSEVDLVVSSPTPAIIEPPATPTPVQIIQSSSPSAVVTSSRASLLPQPTIPPASSPPIIPPPVSSAPPAESPPPVLSELSPAVLSPSPDPSSIGSAPPPPPPPAAASSAGLGDVGQPTNGHSQPPPVNSVPDAGSSNNGNGGNAPAPLPVAPLVDLDGSPDKVTGDPALATDPNACSCSCVCPFEAFGIPPVEIPSYTPEPLPSFLASTFSTVVTPVMMSSNVPAVTPNAPAVTPNAPAAMDDLPVGGVASSVPARVQDPPVQATPPALATSGPPIPTPTPGISNVPIVLETSTTDQDQPQPAVTQGPAPAQGEDFDINNVELHSALTLKIGG